MKRNLIIMLLFSFLSACVGKNKLDIKISEGLDSKKIKIMLANPGGLTGQVVYQNELLLGVPNVYGENDWIVFYGDSLKANFRHIKTNRNDRHKYSFNFYEKNGLILVDIDISGVSKYKKTIELSKF